ncbi:ABC transporter ATP-binding protein, partial [Candidatus Bipolaricaulota bacterium]
MKLTRRNAKKPEPIPWALMRRTLAFLRPHRKALAIAIASTSASAIFWFARPYLLRRLTDTAIASDYSVFLLLVGASFGVAIIEMLSTFFRGSSVAALGALAIRDMRGRLTAHIQRLPLPTIAAYHSGDLVSRFNNDLDQASALFRRFPDYIYQPLQLIGALAFMLWISPKLTLVVCGSMPISVYLFERVVRPMQKHSGDKMEALATANASFQDAIRGAFIVRAFGLQRLLGSRFRTQAEEVEHHDRKNHIRNMLSFIPFLTLRYIPQLLVPIYGGLMAFRGEISVGDLLAVNWLIWPIFLPLEAFLAWIREVRESAPALKRTFELLDAPCERSDGAVATPASNGSSIAFDAVSFSYNGTGQILDRMTFRVESGQSVALVGSSGCGKTTILKLLCGFVDAIGGTIEVFGKPLRDLSLSSIRENISLMAQDAFLFPTTVAENIGHGRRDASRE